MSHYDDWHRTCNDHCYGRCNVHWHGGCADNMHRSLGVVSWRGQHDNITPMSRHFTFKGRHMFKRMGESRKNGHLNMYAEVEENPGNGLTVSLWTMYTRPNWRGFEIHLIVQKCA